MEDVFKILEEHLKDKSEAQCDEFVSKVMAFIDTRKATLINDRGNIKVNIDHTVLK